MDKQKTYSKLSKKKRNKLQKKHLRERKFGRKAFKPHKNKNRL